MTLEYLVAGASRFGEAVCKRDPREQEKVTFAPCVQRRACAQRMRGEEDWRSERQDMHEQLV